MNRLSRRQWLQGMAGLAGAGTAARLGLWPSTAFAQEAPEKAALLVVFLNGGYNALFGSADSFAGEGTFGVTGSNQRMLGNGLVVDGPTFGNLPAFALEHMATVGVRHGITGHEAAQDHCFTAGNSNAAIKLAAAMGGEGAIKCVQLGGQGMPGGREPENGVSLQTINDMKSTIAALGGITDATVPDRGIAERAIAASRFMSAKTLVNSPRLTKTLGEGYGAAVETLQKPVKSYNYVNLANAYGFSPTTTAVTNFTTQVAAAEVMIEAGANVCVAVNGGWDTHGDRDGSNVRTMMNDRILPSLRVFINRMVADSRRNVNVVIMGDFARSLPGSDHAAGVSATVIGKNVRVGTTGRVDADVRLSPGTPQGLGLWAYLARLTNLPFQPFGSNPHTGLVLT
ncbi:MAG: DUF1501 domain-containing protein [Archangium sp.]|nr:DUF1501 domain-containing protein [Archangium sp.]MDP3155710.1 DUF1501 domain-containing protein [Archangium sp.]MDP3569741.1 DUF1501 domain-containing protein [Archangium sp.]